MFPERVTFGPKSYLLDRFGFLDPPGQWDDEFAGGMAGMVGIHGGLNEEHWRFIRYLRRKFIIEKTVPVVVLACRDNGLRLSKLRALFPAGYHRGACRLAGINYAFMYKHNPWLTYETRRALQQEFPLTATGFLSDFECWNERFARRIAEEWRIEGGLSQRHLDVIHFLRRYFKKHRNIPTVYEACKANGLSLDDLHRLFPDGYRRGACRISGLPSQA